MNHDQLYKTWSLGKLYEQEAYQEQHHSLQQQWQSIHPLHFEVSVLSLV